MKNKPHIFVIVLDTLRKDYASYLEKRLEERGFIAYENVIAPSSWTTPSHASMFTGMYPLYHKAHETKTKKGFEVKLTKSKTYSLVTFFLKELGYKTYLFSANPHISPAFGFRGFDFMYFPDVFPPSVFQETDLKKLSEIIKNKKVEKFGDMLKVLLKEKEYYFLLRLTIMGITRIPYLYVRNIVKRWPLEKGATAILNKLKKISFEKRSSFVFVNFIEPHEPYSLNYLFQSSGNLTGKSNPKVIRQYQQCYPKSAGYAMKKALEFVEVLEEKNLYDNSLIIITSDHGQLLGEDNRIGHGTFLYDELLKVPLIVKYPSGTDVRLSDNSEKYISLIKLKQLILEVARNKKITDDILYSDFALAESFGIHDSLAFSSLENREEFEKYRIAIYYNGTKAIFNVTDWKFEEMSQNIENKEAIRKIIVNYLRNGLVVSKVRGQ